MFCVCTYYHYLVFQIICERLSKPNEAIVKEIALLLRDSFFVPVLRSIDAVTQPQVGDLFSSKQPLVSCFKIKIEYSTSKFNSIPVICIRHHEYYI